MFRLLALALVLAVGLLLAAAFAPGEPRPATYMEVSR